jgi:hypothetical protein
LADADYCGQCTPYRVTPGETPGCGLDRLPFAEKDLCEHGQHARRQHRWHITARLYRSADRAAPRKLRDTKVGAYLLTKIRDTPAVLA